MELEKLATSAVTTALATTDCLSSFINSGDKEPCWDGHIYIHENSQRTKKNIKKVSTQVKGKAVSPKAVKRKISYSVSYDDLYAYMMNGGTVFFVVYLDEETGSPLQIYYKCLLPFVIKELFKVKKGNYSIKFNKFPSAKDKKTEIFLNFYEDSRKQASFAGKDTPSIEDLTNQGLLESLTFSYSVLGNHNHRSEIPKMLDGNSITMYANIKGSSAPIPVMYYESISHVKIGWHDDVPVTVNKRQYYSGYKIVISSDSFEYLIGSSVTLKTPNNDTLYGYIPFSVKIELKGTLSEQISSIEFIIAMIEYGSFCLGDVEIPVTLPKGQNNTQDLAQILDDCMHIKSLLQYMNVQRELEIDQCTSEDMQKLNTLLRAILNKLPVKENPVFPANIQKMAIANLNIAVVYIEQENGEFNLYDYFATRFHVNYEQGNSAPERVSQFCTMSVDDYLTLDNINLDTIVEDYKSIPSSDLHLEHGNAAMLNMLKAYDCRPSSHLLKAAMQLCDWQSENSEYTTPEICLLNRLQIILRERSLDFHEKAELYSIITSTSDSFLKIGAFLLLDEQSEAQKLLDSLSPEHLGRFREFPIYKFYKSSEET